MAKNSTSRRRQAKIAARLGLAGHRIEPANAANLCAPAPGPSEAAPGGAAEEPEGKPERRRKKA